MNALQNDHARYLVAELGVLATELRNPRSSLSRVQLATLAERALKDAAHLSGCRPTPIAKPAPAGAPIGANVVPLFPPSARG